MRSASTISSLLIATLLAGCNLTTAPPTPTLAPTQPVTFTPFAPAEPPADSTPVNPDCPATPAGWMPYTVVSGDNLSTLAEATGSTVNELVTNNCLENPDQIYAGFVLYLPQMPVISP